jgi:Tol biopolymer transport system component
MQADGSGVTRVSDPAGDARNHAWSPDSKLLAYQSDADGDNDIYVYEIATQTTRLISDNTIEDYAPTWYCNAPVLVFTSDVTGDPNLFRTDALPMSAPAILVDQEASQLTFDLADDVYPLDSPSEEFASRRQWLSPSVAYPALTKQEVASDEG